MERIERNIWNDCSLEIWQMSEWYGINSNRRNGGRKIKWELLDFFFFENVDYVFIFLSLDPNST